MRISDKTLDDLVRINADFATDPMELLNVEALRELQSMRANIEELLSHSDPDVVRCHEGGGPEDLIGSLVLTMMRTRNSRDKAIK